MKLENKRVSLALLVVGLVTVGLVGVVAAKSGFWDVVSQQTSQLLADKVMADYPATPTDGAFGASLNVRGDTSFQGLSLKDSNSSVTLKKWIEYFTIGTASSTFVQLENRYPGTIMLNLADSHCQLQGTTSATTKFYMGTSTAALAPEYNATIADRGIIDGRESVTGTVNDLIDPLFEARQVSASKNASSTKINIPQGVWINGFMTTGGSNAIHGSSVTSTAGRGFTTDSYCVLSFERVATSTKE